MNKIYGKCFLLSLFWFSLIGISRSSYTKHVIFDLGGVLVSTNKSYVMRKTGLLSLLRLTLRHGNPRIALFDTLALCEPCMQHPFVSFDEEENELPPLFCDFLCGFPGKIIMERLNNVSKDEDILKLAHCIFEPETFAASQKIIKQGERFVRYCIDQGHDVYILSNWDPASFPLLVEKYPDFFNLFSGIIISGNCHLIKPDPAIFHILMDSYHLNPAECIFIDNQFENIGAAESLGIRSIFCKSSWNGSPNFKKVKKQFNQLIEEEETERIPAPEEALDA